MNKIPLPFTFGAGLFCVGLLTLVPSLFIISISQNADLWWQVLNTIQRSWWNLIIAYVVIGISSCFIALGVAIMIFGDRRAELPTKTVRDLMGKERKEGKRFESNKHFKVMWTMLSIGFILTAILVYINYNGIGLAVTQKYLSVTTMIFLIGAIPFLYLGEKKEKSHEQHT